MGLNSSPVALDSNLTDLVQSLQAQVTSLANQGQAGINFGTVQSNVGNQGWIQGPYQGLIDSTHSLIISVFIPDWAKHLLRVNLYWKLRGARTSTATVTGGTNTANSGSVAPGGTDFANTGATDAPSGTRTVAAGNDDGKHTHPTGTPNTGTESADAVVASSTHTHPMTGITHSHAHSATHVHTITHTHNVSQSVGDAAIPTEQIDLLDSTGVTTYYSSSAATAGPFDLLPYVTNGLLSQPNGYGPTTGFTDFKLAVDASGIPTPNLVGIEAWLDIVVIGQPIA